MPDQRDLLEVLKRELQHLQRGGYRRSLRQYWRPAFIFEDSPTCPNADIQDTGVDTRVPCKQCVLMPLVPPEQREVDVPCRLIPLNAAGETIDYFYRCGTQEELEAALDHWLRETIARMEAEEAPLSDCA